MYKQTLYKIIEPVQGHDKIALNQKRQFKYGYNKRYDMVVISKNGRIGEIYEIQGLKIALPQAERVYKRHRKDDMQYWEAFDYPKELAKINSIFEWEKYPDDFHKRHTPYIEEEFRRREDGFWFRNKGKDTYVTGSHYTYLQWSKIDVGKPDFRESNRIFWIFWEACKADNRCYGMCYLKNRRSGFSFMSSSEVVNIATLSYDSRFGILSKSANDAKQMFTGKVVPISLNYPFFFKPIQAGMDRPKTELAYRVPETRFTRRKINEEDELANLEGLNTTIDWKATGDNSYDGEKLKFMIHDESFKWLKPNSILNNWNVTKTCLRLGSKIVGKCMMGSTCNAKDKGGEEGEKIYRQSNVNKRNKNGQTTSGLYSLFIPMEWNFEGFIDKYGFPVFDTPSEPIEGIDGELIHIGVLEHWENEVDGLKEDQDTLNEYYRQYPKTIEHAFRDEAKNSLFNLAKIYEQIDYNGDVASQKLITQGNFQWENNIKDSRVIFTPSKNGRFKLSWIPPQSLQNRIIQKNGLKSPANEHLGAFGCDSYDITGTVDGKGSKGSLHGLTKFSMENVPANMFFLEYMARPQMAEIFFEDVLMALVFYGMPVLAENNKPRLLYHLKRRGYRGYSMSRPDKLFSKLSATEREIGGIPNNSEDIIQSHAGAIESYITQHIGLKGDGTYGNMYFNDTLNDWSRFDIRKRTKHDASISSGLAIMACNKLAYKPTAERQTTTINFGLSKYENSGISSKIQN